MMLGVVVILLVLLVATGLMLYFVLREGEIAMNERRALVFEVYRYAVCFVMVLFFSLTAFQLIVALIAQANEPAALAGPGVGVLMSMLVFAAHWLMKNPALPKEQ